MPYPYAEDKMAWECDIPNYYEEIYLVDLCAIPDCNHLRSGDDMLCRCCRREADTMALIKGVDDEVPDMEEGDGPAVTVGMLKLWLEKLDPNLPVCVTLDPPGPPLLARGVVITATSLTVYNDDYLSEY
jgi:hypothetical protein